MRSTLTRAKLITATLALGAFSPDRVMSCLIEAGTNENKPHATEQFLAELEDYEAAMQPGWRP